MICDSPYAKFVSLCFSFSGINRNTRYQLMEMHPNVFSIDPRSGIVSLVGTLDREEHPEYNVTVVAYNEVKKWGLFIAQACEFCLYAKLCREEHPEYNVTVVAYNEVRKWGLFIAQACKFCLYAKRCREEHPEYNVTVVAYNEVRKWGLFIAQACEFCLYAKLCREEHPEYKVTVVAYNEVRKWGLFITQACMFCLYSISNSVERNIKSITSLLWLTMRSGKLTLFFAQAFELCLYTKLCGFRFPPSCRLPPC